MGIDLRVVQAIFARDFARYLANPAGYVFLTLFIGLTGAAAFLQEGFFARNLADLASLNALMPTILMLFVPALTMGSWAEERRAGTDELLLTLPVRDVEVVLGKYLGALGVYTVALLLSTSHVAVLAYLGDPDLGLIAATYFGYWLTGAAFVAVGLFASIVSSNLTVAFILGALACAGLVFAGAAPWSGGVFGAVLCGGLAALVSWAIRGRADLSPWLGVAGVGLGLWAWLGWLGADFTEAVARLDVGRHVQAFGEGLVRLGDVAFFVGLAVFVLYGCTYVLGRRHW